MTEITALSTTDEQKANLRKLADYLETLPKDYVEFDMGSFFRSKDGIFMETELAYVEGSRPVSCGTVACAVGHGPAAGIPFTDNDWHYSSGRRMPSWHRYSEKFIDSLRGFDWMFSGSWSVVDNHHYGAAARIRFFLEHGGIPRDFDCYDLEKKSPYDEEVMMNLYAPYRKK